jgi:hypothetical protein
MIKDKTILTQILALFPTLISAKNIFDVKTITFGPSK